MEDSAKETLSLRLSAVIGKDGPHLSGEFDGQTPSEAYQFAEILGKTSGLDIQVTEDKTEKGDVGRTIELTATERQGGTAWLQNTLLTRRKQDISSILDEALDSRKFLNKIRKKMRGSENPGRRPIKVAYQGETYHMKSIEEDGQAMIWADRSGHPLYGAKSRDMDKQLQEKTARKQRREERSNQVRPTGPM